MTVKSHSSRNNWSVRNAPAAAVSSPRVGRSSNRRSISARPASSAAFNCPVAALRSETSLRAYAALIANRPSQVHALAGQNPMNWLAQKPPNYLGEFYSPDPKKLSSGNWFFDRSDGLLVYLLNQSNTFDSEGSELLKFKVSLSQGSKKAAAGAGESLELVPVQVRKEIAVR